MTAGAAAYPAGRDETAQRLHVLYDRKRYQQVRAGNWAPFTSTAPVLEHLELLREAGMTQEEISRQSGVSITAMSRAAKNQRMTTAAADALLGVQLVKRDDGRRATHALRSLVADGWTLQQLADATGLTARTVGRTVNGHTTPAAGSAVAIIEALDQLRFEDPGDSAASVRPVTAPNRPGGTQPPRTRRQRTSTRSPSTRSSTAGSSRFAQPSSVPRCSDSPGGTPTTRSADAWACPPGPSCATASAKGCRPTSRYRQPAEARPGDHRPRHPPPDQGPRVCRARGWSQGG